MIEATPDETIAAIHALRAAGSTAMQISDSEREKAVMTRKMSKARDIENMKDDPVWFKQHREDTKHPQWQDGMYVMLTDLECDYELAVVENSIRNSVYFTDDFFFDAMKYDNCLGVLDGECGTWCRPGKLPLKTQLTRAQALYIATGNTDI